MAASVVPFAPLNEQQALPHSIEAEQALIGAILVRNEAFYDVAGLIDAEHFHEPVHKVIFEQMARMIAAGAAASYVSLRPYLQDVDLGGMTVGQYMARLAAEAVTVSGAPGYAKIVRDLAVRRRMISVGDMLLDRARNSGFEADSGALIDEAEVDLLEARAEVPRGHLAGQDADEGAAWMLDRIRGIREGRAEVPRIPTGIGTLDRALGGGLGRGHLVLIAGRPGMGKAQPLTARVHTPSGWRIIGDLAVGDRVSSVDGAESLVEGVFEQGRRPVYRVVFSDGRETRCCAEHLWEVSYRDWPAPRVVETSHLIAMLGKVRYRGRLSVRLHSGALGAVQDLPLDPWLLGALLGDGGLSTDTVRLSTPDAEIVDRAGEALPAGHRLTHQQGPDFTITSDGQRNAVKAALNDLGLMGCRSETKFVPPIYLAADRAARLAVLQGLLDTDGWVERQGSVRFSSASRQLAADVVELARSLGFWAKPSVKAAYLGSIAAGRVRKLDAHQVCITGRGVAEILTLAKKRDRLADRSFFRALTITAIEPDGEAPCRCISVSHPTRLYITDEHIVTHNTVVMTTLSRQVARQHGTLVFQLEVPKEQQYARYLADLAYSPNRPMTFGQIEAGRDLDDEAMWLLESAQKQLARLHLRVETDAVSIAQIAASIKTAKRRFAKRGVRLGAVFIDYLKFVKVSDRYRGQRVLEIGEISGALKTIAKQEDICVVLLTQLNRQVEQEGRADRRPTSADLRDSGELEQDADVVMLLYREAVYLQRKLRASNDGDIAGRLVDAKHKLEIILGKNRSGAEETLDLWCDVASSSIASHARGQV